MQISDIFYHHKNSIFTEKPEEILSFLMILDENPNFFQKIGQNLHIQNFN